MIKRIWAVVAGAFFLSAVAGAANWPQWRGLNRDGHTTESVGKWPPTELWRKTSVGVGYSTVSVSNGRVYTMGWANNQDTVYCFDADTGTEIWSTSYACAKGGSYPGPLSTPTVTGGKVYTFSRKGHLYCFDAVTGNVEWNVTVSTGEPNWGISGSPLVEGNLVIVNIGGAGTAVAPTLVARIAN